MTKNQFVSRRKKQLAHLSMHLRKLGPRWDEVSEIQKDHLLSLLSRLYADLRAWLTTRELQRLMAGVAVVVSTSVQHAAHAQNFAPAIPNFFGITLSGPTLPELADLDGDGDQDLYFNNYYYGIDQGNIVYIENTGTATAPVYTSVPIQNPFGLDPGPGFVGQSFVDLDGDGDMDLIGSRYDNLDYDARFVFQENVGTSVAPQFAPRQENPFGLVPDANAYITRVSYGDVDNDGDYDLLDLVYDSVNDVFDVQFQENVGTPTSPSFMVNSSSPFNFVNPTSGYLIFPELGDLDWDGDLDCLIGSYGDGEMAFIENTGNSTTGAFANAPQSGAFGLVNPVGEDLSVPVIADVDGDGDMDVLVGGYYNGLLFFENLDIASNVVDIDETSLFSVYPQPGSDLLNITHNSEPIDQVIIIDGSGKQIRTWAGRNTNVRMDISDLAIGMYVLEVSSASGISRKSVAINR